MKKIKKAFTLAESGFFTEAVSFCLEAVKPLKTQAGMPFNAKNSRPVKAFTLAEILITLSIIGIVAALTIPTLIQRTGNEEYVSRLNKVYSTLSQATEAIMTEQGSPTVWATNADNLYNAYLSHLRVSKACGTAAGCFTRKLSDGTAGILNLDGNENRGWNTEGSSTHKQLILSDGASISIAFDNALCNSSGIYANNECAHFHVDINGAKKPNQHGRDIFEFMLTKDGLVPAGVNETDPDYKNTCNKNGNAAAKQGAYCTARVIAEGDMNY